jgi:predicted CoA-substrate-specific enzyme activase
MTKVVIIDKEEVSRANVIKHTGAEHRRLANKVMEEALRQADLSFNEITYVVATGYGRIAVPFADRQITELTCHARGVSSFFPDVRLAIDIGGQDAKGLKIKDGKLVDFVMSDKCAAGTGRYLEVIAKTLGFKLDDLGGISLKSNKKISMTSVCTVFVQQEAVSLLSRGVAIEDIVAGIHDAIATRVAGMVERLTVEPDVLFTGGVAKNIGVVKALEQKLGLDILVPENPLLSGAMGAALLAKEITLKALSRGESISKGNRCLDEATFYNNQDERI